MATTKILTQLAVDDPLVQDASYRFDSADRQYIDEQIRGVETHLVNCIVKGKQATYFRVDTISAALVAGDVVCVYGTLAGEITVGKAVAPYVTTAGSALGVVLVAAAPGALALVAFTGLLPSTVTGLATGLAGYAVVNTTTGRLDYSATVTGITLGKIDPTGSVLVYQVPAASSGGTPGGTTGQIQYNNGGVFAGANITTGGANLTGTTSLLLATTNGTLDMSAVGNVRAKNTNGTLFHTNSSAMFLGQDNAFANRMASISAWMGTGDMSFGTTPATSGDIRVTYAGAGTRNIVVVKNSTATDTPIVRTGPGDACTFGNAALDWSAPGSAGSMSFSGIFTLSSAGKQAVETTASELFLGTSSGYAAQFTNIRMYAGAGTYLGVGSATLFSLTATVVTLAAPGGIPVINTSAGNTVNIGTTVSFGGAAQASGINIYAAPSGNVGIGLSGNTKVYINGTSGITEFWDKVGGGASANAPFKFATATIAGAPTSVTATAAQYSCPMIIITNGTAVATYKFILPLIAGAEWTVVNNTSYTITIGGATGGTTTISSGLAGKVLCPDGVNFVRCT